MLQLIFTVTQLQLFFFYVKWIFGLFLTCSDLFFLSALRKSQKEAGILVNRYARGKQTNIHGEENSNKSLKLEFDLTDQWRSLFRHMEDVFANENSQLVSVTFCKLHLLS